MNRHLLPDLPAYPCGRISDALYHAGVGRYGIFNGGQPCHYEWSSEEAPLVYSRYFAYAGYTAESSEDGTVILSNGHSEFSALREGSSLTLTQTRAVYPQDEPVWGRSVTETTLADFEQYIGTLLADGFERTWENRIEENVFYTLVRDGRRIHASYYPAEATARFIDDSLSAPIETFGGGAPIPGEGAVLCQFALHYGPMIPQVTADCGMLYFIKLPDNSIFLIDGGEIGQATDAACEEVMRLMRTLTHTPENEKIRIAAWLCTHAHDDHMDVFSKLLRFHHDELTVERVIFNFPHHEYYGLMLQSYVMMERLHRFCPDAKYLKAHTGHQFTLAGVDFEILLTHEDWMSVTGREHSWDLNDTSLVIKVSFGGASFLLLGDINRQAEERLLKHFSAETLHCSAMQAAHHLINQLPELYPVVQPEIALVPQHICSAVESNPNFGILSATVPPQNQFFASCATDLFEFQDGRLILKQRLFPRGGAFDHSQV